MFLDKTFKDILSGRPGFVVTNASKDMIYYYKDGKKIMSYEYFNLTNISPFVNNFG